MNWAKDHIGRMAAAAALALLLALSISYEIAPAGAQHPSHTPAKLQAVERLSTHAAEQGQVRVIVALDVPPAEGLGVHPLLAILQRRAIHQAQAAVVDGLPSAGSDLIRKFDTLPLAVLRVDSAGLQSLAANPLVIAIQADVAVPPLLFDSVPHIGADLVWEAGFTGAGQVVAILDTGVDSSHEFLSGKVIAGACFSTTDDELSSVSLCPDGSEEQIGIGAGLNCSLSITGCNHGTHVAGIAAGSGAAMSGVAKDAQIIAIQVFSRFDSETFCGVGRSPCIATWSSDQIAALNWLAGQADGYSIASANMSLGGGAYTANCDWDLRKGPIDQLRSLGIATVIAAGNSGNIDAIMAPACISSAVSVGSTTISDTVSSFSNIASFILLVAPGSSIYSSVPGGFSTFSGTSMAAPHVAGAWALLKSQSPAASVDEVLVALRTTGVSIDDLRDESGVIDLRRIQVDAAFAVLATPTPTPMPTFTSSPTPTTPTSTFTPEPPTPTPEPSSTDTPEPPTATPTSEPSSTHTPEPPTATPTPVPSSTHTPEPSSPTPTPDAGITPTLGSPTSTPDASVTPTLEPFTATPTPEIATSTPTPSHTAEASPTPIIDPLPADINLDGVVDVLDVQLCVNVFLGTETAPAVVVRADVNSDEVVDVLDVQLVVNDFLEG